MNVKIEFKEQSLLGGRLIGEVAISTLPSKADRWPVLIERCIAYAEKGTISFSLATDRSSLPGLLNNELVHRRVCDMLYICLDARQGKSPCVWTEV